MSDRCRARDVMHNYECEADGPHDEHFVTTGWAGVVKWEVPYRPHERLSDDELNTRWAEVTTMRNSIESMRVRVESLAEEYATEWRERGATVRVQG